MKVLSNEITAVQKFGRVNIETRVGELEYSYNIGTDYDDNYQLENGKLKDLTEIELDKIDDIMRKEMYKLK